MYDPEDVSNRYGQLSARALQRLAEQAAQAPALNAGSMSYALTTPQQVLVVPESSATSLTVEYDDTTLTIDNVTILQIDPATITLTNPSPGVARISATSPGTGIEVKEADGTPDYTSVPQVILDQTTGLAIQSGTSGITVTLELLDAAPGQWGVITTTDQILPAGIKSWEALALQVSTGASDTHDPVLTYLSYTSISGLTGATQFNARSATVNGNGLSSIVVRDVQFGPPGGDSSYRMGSADPGLSNQDFVIECNFLGQIAAFRQALGGVNPAVALYLYWGGTIVCEGIRIGTHNTAGSTAGATGTFLSGDAVPKTITVTGGIITGIV